VVPSVSRLACTAERKTGHHELDECVVLKERAGTGAGKDCLVEAVGGGQLCLTTSKNSAALRAKTEGGEGKGKGRRTVVTLLLTLRKHVNRQRSLPALDELDDLVLVLERNDGQNRTEDFLCVNQLLPSSVPPTLEEEKGREQREETHRSSTHRPPSRP
jgi:hypothetical protein